MGHSSRFYVLEVTTFPCLVSRGMAILPRFDPLSPAGRQILKSTGTGSLSPIHYRYQSGTTMYGSCFSCSRRIETRELIFCVDDVGME